MTQTEHDGDLGAAAINLAKHGHAEVAQVLRHGRLFDQSYFDKFSGQFSSAGWKVRAVLYLPIDVIDEWKETYGAPALEAFRRCADGRDVHLESLKVVPMPEASGWRERLKSLGDWGEDASPDWWAINQRLDELKDAFGRAVTPEDLKDVGRRARDLMIAAARKAYRPSMLPDGQEAPKGADAKAHFDLILSARVSDGRNADLRKVLRAAWDLASTVTHSGEDRAVDAFAAAQATILVVRTLAKIDEELNR